MNTRTPASCHFILLVLWGLLAMGPANAQTKQDDSIAESYYEEYETGESFEDSVKRTKANAFDTLYATAFPPLISRTADSSFIGQLKKSSSFDYVKKGIAKTKPDPLPQPFDMGIRWLYIVFGAFFIFLIVYLVFNKTLLLKKPKKDVEAVSEGEDTNGDIFSIDYARAISDAVSDKNYRLGIRLHYLQLLKKLSERNIIHYQPGKTNFDYLLQVRTTPHYQAFLRLTQHYEYSWYGKFPINENQYNQISQSFSQFT